jgi:hypothetical protein
MKNGSWMMMLVALGVGVVGAACGALGLFSGEVDAFVGMTAPEVASPVWDQS